LFAPTFFNTGLNEVNQNLLAVLYLSLDWFDFRIAALVILFAFTQTV
jgi:hypothetical protein